MMVWRWGNNNIHVVYKEKQFYPYNYVTKIPRLFLSIVCIHTTSLYDTECVLEQRPVIGVNTCRFSLTFLSYVHHYSVELLQVITEVNLKKWSRRYVILKFTWIVWCLSKPYNSLLTSWMCYFASDISLKSTGRSKLRPCLLCSSKMDT